MKSVMQKSVALSVTEAEIISAVLCVQEMLYGRRVLISLGLKVKIPIILEIDNSGTTDLANG